MEFNRIITLLRKERGITQKQAAQELGISQAQLSHYEKGIRECGLEFVVQIADYYNVSCDYLLGRSAERSGQTIKVEELPDAGGATSGSIYRGSVVINPPADGAKANVSCESLMLDEKSQSDTIPAIIVKNDNIDLGHEASIGRISDEAIFYLMSRGLSEDDARAMLVRGFVEPVSKALPLEYAVEMNNLINLELKGSLK